MAPAQPIPQSKLPGTVSHPQLQQQAGFGSLQMQQQAANAAYLRRSHSLATFQLNTAEASHPQPTNPGWQPASMPEVPGILGSTDDQRRNLMHAASAPNHPRGLSHHLQNGTGSAPVFSPFELKNMMDESSLEIFESQSHLLDPETRLQLQVRQGKAPSVHTFACGSSNLLAACVLMPGLLGADYSYVCTCISSCLIPNAINLRWSL